MSAFGGKADVRGTGLKSPLIAINGHWALVVLSPSLPIIHTSHGSLWRGSPFSLPRRRARSIGAVRHSFPRSWPRWDVQDQELSLLSPESADRAARPPEPDITTPTRPILSLFFVQSFLIIIRDQLLARHGEHCPRRAGDASQTRANGGQIEQMQVHQRVLAFDRYWFRVLINIQFR